jgi:glyoxylase-like metal-dependent hydrolase (beta-lactamase superfamily II)
MAQVEGFFHPESNTIAYLVADPATKRCAIIDSCLDFEAAAGRTRTEHADKMLARVSALGLGVDWILETHVHADHLSAAPYIRDRTGGRIAIGDRITEVQHTFGELYNAEQGFRRDGSQFDHLFRDGERFSVGSLEAEFMHTPGHTPACGTYLIDGDAFVGDTLFMPDFGTARADFPGGDARALYRSIRRILALPPETVIWICHDYKAPGRDEFAWKTTVAEERARNPHVHDGVTEDEFVAMREAKDKTLSAPRLLLPSIQVNMRAGQMPPAEDNGVVYLKMPLNVIGAGA